MSQRPLFGLNEREVNCVFFLINLAHPNANLSIVWHFCVFVGYFYLAAETHHRAPEEYFALVMRYRTMSWCPPKAAICKALHPSLFANRISAPNFTNNLTSSRFPSMTDWCSAVCPSGPKELTLNSQLVIFWSNEWSSFVLPFFTASWNTLCGAEQVATSPWLMILAWSGTNNPVWSLSIGMVRLCSGEDATAMRLL